MMIYELRVYTAAPGTIAALSGRFEKHILRFFDRHGIKVIGFWETEIGDVPELTYILAFKDLGERQRALDAFHADPEWEAIRVQTNREAGRDLFTKANVKIMKPTRYSPLQ
jgi:hypothetical protein